ncbi:MULTISPECIES: hypothetical protein [Bacillus cereus group]|uniref:Uncharacterized protein n=1 Tax=Bacillus thuringiensis TaxID=1428 RepID=A0A9X6WHT3_BACTU|nr:MULTISPECIES: hypothetical protein [Bacillus cereus group]PFJ28961.1 hypothetical protein COJ15_32350 [Bacillus thuringiensis]PGP14563.1 hypothetical protein COA01_29825 [Bacillus cereus]
MKKNKKKIIFFVIAFLVFLILTIFIYGMVKSNDSKGLQADVFNNLCSDGSNADDFSKCK